MICGLYQKLYKSLSWTRYATMRLSEAQSGLWERWVEVEFFDYLN